MRKKPKLEPVDVDRCQAEIKEGSFMTFGPRIPYQCSNAPVFIAVEKVPSEKDGLIGAMSLCQNCSRQMIEIMGSDFAHFFSIKRR